MTGNMHVEMQCKEERRRGVVCVVCESYHIKWQINFYTSQLMKVSKVIAQLEDII